MDRTLQAILKENARLEREIESLRLQLRASRATVAMMERSLDDYRRRETYHYKVTMLDADGNPVNPTDNLETEAK